MEKKISEEQDVPTPTGCTPGWWAGDQRLPATLPHVSWSHTGPPPLAHHLRHPALLFSLVRSCVDIPGKRSNPRDEVPFSVETVLA